MEYQLTSEFKPTGDQPTAIAKLVEGVNNGEPAQVLLGATGTGKTFTMANVIAETGKPALVLCHNKTLAAQLYGEFKAFFPNNAVEYYISYYDYYQPESYIASTDVFIEKDMAINQEIEKLRLHTTSTLLSGRRDIVVIASVSCIYGIGNPEEFAKNVIFLKPGMHYTRNNLLYQFVQILYSRTEVEFTRGSFRVKGDTVDVFPAYADYAIRIYFFGDEIESVHKIDPVSGKKLSDEAHGIALYPANLFVTGKETLNTAIKQIQDDMVHQHAYFEKEGRDAEAKRIMERTEFDLEMIRELGYCSGIENYSRYFDGRSPGSRPFCLLDYFPNDYLLVVDESHATMPQIRAMWGGDRSRKTALIEYGFRLPSALDNRPLTFNEFESMYRQAVFVSATPSDYELTQAGGVVVEQIIRPTGLLDPEIDIRPSINQIDDLLDEVDNRVKMGDRVLVTTLTKRMAEELSKYMDRLGIKVEYVHSEVKTLDRVEILRKLRLGEIDVLIGVNLLREGLDLPEVSLVAILDADKEGFLRDQRSLIQTMGRAARNDRGKVIMYADRMTGSMQRAIDETNRRRATQLAYNEANGITPRTVRKSHSEIMGQTALSDYRIVETPGYANAEADGVALALAAEPVVAMMTKPELEKLIKTTEKQMEAAAKDLDFLTAAKLRDELAALRNMLKSKRD
ncbi:excinuclease ABC subunit UvrB [Hymenobacter negativus]|uniref:UvrABC system protein B n=1 Tax=Hymenobacter negativus TaxID=2795026 RepID=A0ABS3QBV1_9BACT|nr:excinuclease ABC subunit UvrB [Hymenobacter negativus]MBO2008719.1 excinuclease ABC subunit UvrB [Hymenobacter negativus]